MPPSSDFDFLQITLSWIEERLPFFDPRFNEEQYQLTHLKAFDELCLLAVLKHRQCSELYLSRRVIDFCLSVIGEVPIPRVFVDNVAHFQLLAMPAALQALSGQHYYLRELLALCIPKMALCSAERLPHRLLDVIYCAGALNVGEEIFGSLSLLKRAQVAATQSSNLFLGVCPLSGTLNDFYALTHTIFFATDFGSVSATRAFPGLKTTITIAIIELAILRFLSEENLDIVAELVWCLIILGKRDGPVIGLAVSSMSFCVKNHGFLRGPKLVGALPVAEEHVTTYLNYHSTLLACALFSNGLIKCTLNITRGNICGYGEMHIGYLYKVGANLRGIADAHPLVRYQLEEELAVLLQREPYFASARFGPFCGVASVH